MDSLASLNVPAIGYGIRYEFGIFDQEIRDGWQVEKTDKWLRLGNPWEICRPEIAYTVSFGGRTEQYHDEQGRFRVRWVPNRVVKGIAYDTPVPAYRDETVNLLRLWKSEAVESSDFEAFNLGDYYKAVDQKVISETVSKVLYPNDEPDVGKVLRLAKQYFFVSCSLQDMLNIMRLRGDRWPVTYRKVLYWVNVKNGRPHKAEFYAISGRLLKTAHYRDFETLGGEIRPTRLVIEDALRKGHRSELEYSGMVLRDLPDKVFTKDYLKKLSR